MSFGIVVCKPLKIKVTIAAGFHLFPFRTEKLSLPAPMVLLLWESRSLPNLLNSGSSSSRSFFLLFLYAFLCIHSYFSLKKIVFFAFLMTCVSFYFLEWDGLHAWLNGLFLAIGFIVHLVLDELYSVDVSNARMKKSFGSALKLCSYNNIPASLVMTGCTLALYWLTPSSLALGKLWNNAQWHEAAICGWFSITRQLFNY